MQLDAVAKKINAKYTAKKKRQQIRERFKRAHRAEGKFARQLKQVARQIGSIVKGLAPKGVPKNPSVLNNALQKYADLIRPWAVEVSKSLIDDISNRDYRSWAELGNEMGRSLKAEIKYAPTGETYRRLMDEQVSLHKLITGGMTASERPESIAKEIMRTEQVSRSKAMLIARTETTRSSTAFVQARATFVGSEGYIWQTAMDGDVRDRHEHLQGKFIKWTEPPVAGEAGMRYHAGAGPNCRCWAEPVIPDVIE